MHFYNENYYYHLTTYFSPKTQGWFLAYTPSCAVVTVFSMSQSYSTEESASALAIPTLAQSTSIYLSFHSRQACWVSQELCGSKRGKQMQNTDWYLNSSKRPVLLFWLGLAVTHTLHSFQDTVIGCGLTIVSVHYISKFNSCRGFRGKMHQNARVNCYCKK